MDSPASAARGRGRASARKRHALPSAPSSHPNSSTAVSASESFDQPSSSTPADGVASSPLPFETPSPTASRGTRPRGRLTEGSMPSSDDADNKGGRSLRKRIRVDYTIEPDEDLSDSSKTTPSSMRTIKRRRTDTACLGVIYNEDEPNGTLIKRRSSEQLQPFRRRNQARKSTVDPQPLISDQHMEDVEVQDTIEVGGHHSEPSDESTLGRTVSNSSHDSKPSHMTPSFDSIPTPRKSDSDTAQTGLDDDCPHNDTAQIKPARTPLSEVFKTFLQAPFNRSLDHLTPYVDGAFVKWPASQLELEPVPDSQSAQQDVAEETADDQLDGTQAGSFKVDTVQEDTPMTDAILPGSPPVEGAMEETPAMSPLPMDTRANSPAPDIELPYIQPRPGRPISFKKTRDPSEFIGLFDDYKSLPPEEVWARLEVVNHALVAWQNEYNELRKITDDEDNAVRYRQEEAAFQHRFRMLTSKDPDANPVRKDFVVKGIRAPRPNPEIAYVRHQDKLMAANYFFDYDDRESKIGFQDPLEQKSGSGKGRLRDRPKQTAKAAEADDGIVVHGKRTRKPPAVFDGIEAASRGSTPVPTQRRRRRIGQNLEENGVVNLSAPTSTSVEQVPPKKKGKGGRPRKHPLPVPIPEDTPVPVEEVQQPNQVGEEKPAKKRRRRRTIIEPAEEEEAPTANDIDQTSPAKAGMRRTNSRLSEVPVGSFYTSSMQSTNPADDSRPPTSSSTATQSTVASNSYQLREKRQKKFSLNPDDEVGEEGPKPKRVRRSKKTQIEDFAATAVPLPTSSPLPVQQSPLEPHPVSKPPTKIKLKNYNGHTSTVPPVSVPGSNAFSVPSSSSSTPPLGNHGISNGAVNGADAADIKDYNQMTKSEKMSHSMKARWASGSMSQAVAKRRATLANKKQAVKAAEPGQQLEATPVITQP
ncbi:hypothetical protein F4802DRAFT_138798 [Xylaria palmicola]|nr:hypothetical protein F4802DRAFT_138798 [Xylaria palmicola]